MPVLNPRTSPPLEDLLPGPYRLVDLELTCWPGSLHRGWSGPEEFREVVQCGFVDFDYCPHSGQIIATYSQSCLCRPFHNPCLSADFTNLTGITNDQLSRFSVPFESVFLAVGDGPVSLLANGDDVEILNENAVIHGLSFSRLSGFDLRPFLSRKLGIPASQCISSRLPGILGDCPSPSLQPHQALDDCWCVLHALAIALGCQVIDQTRNH